MRAPRRQAGFTLIEMMAVVAIFALLAGFVAPNLGLLSSRRLQLQAKQISAQLELARQRAIVTGKTHRLAIDLDGGSYWLEWLVTQAEATGESEASPVLDLRGATPIPMAPPPAATRQFRPLPGLFGRANQLEASVLFQSVQTPEGNVDSGEAAVDFYPDGTASPSEIVLGDDDGHALGLEVLPLAEAVQIVDL